MTMFTSQSGRQRIIDKEANGNTVFKHEKHLGHDKNEETSHVMHSAHRPDGTSVRQVGFTSRLRPRRGAASHTSPRHGKRLKALSVTSVPTFIQSSTNNSLLNSTTSKIDVEENDSLNFALWLTKNQTNEIINNEQDHLKDVVLENKIRGERLQQLYYLEKVEHSLLQKYNMSIPPFLKNEQYLNVIKEKLYEMRKNEKDYLKENEDVNLEHKQIFMKYNRLQHEMEKVTLSSKLYLTMEKRIQYITSAVMGQENNELQMNNKLQKEKEKKEQQEKEQKDKEEMLTAEELEALEKEKAEEKKKQIKEAKRKASKPPRKKKSDGFTWPTNAYYTSLLTIYSILTEHNNQHHLDILKNEELTQRYKYIAIVKQSLLKTDWLHMFETSSNLLHQTENEAVVNEIRTLGKEMRIKYDKSLKKKKRKNKNRKKTYKKVGGNARMSIIPTSTPFVRLDDFVLALFDWFDNQTERSQLAKPCRSFRSISQTYQKSNEHQYLLKERHERMVRSKLKN